MGLRAEADHSGMIAPACSNSPLRTSSRSISSPARIGRFLHHVVFGFAAHAQVNDIADDRLEFGVAERAELRHGRAVDALRDRPVQDPHGEACACRRLPGSVVMNLNNPWR